MQTTTFWWSWSGSLIRLGFGASRILWKMLWRSALLCSAFCSALLCVLLWLFYFWPPLKERKGRQKDMEEGSEHLLIFPTPALSLRCLSLSTQKCWFSWPTWMGPLPLWPSTASWGNRTGRNRFESRAVERPHGHQPFCCYCCCLVVVGLLLDVLARGPAPLDGAEDGIGVSSGPIITGARPGRCRVSHPRRRLWGDASANQDEPARP